MSFEVCQSCPHLEPCKALSKNRFQGIPASKVKFDFIPQKLQSIAPYSDMDELQATYSLCYFSVYECEPHDHIGRIDSAVSRMADIVEEQGCSVKLFIMAVMTASKRSNPDVQFYANMLFGPSAISRFDSCREECRVQFGQFDFKSLEMTNPSAMIKRFVHSEVLFGSFIVDSTVKQEGEVSMSDFFLLREIAFEPFWLAIEDSYFNSVLVPHLENKIFRTTESTRLRSIASQARRVLIKNSARAKSVFQLRESVMIEAVDSVLKKYRLNGNDFLFSEVFTSAKEFWLRLGLAVRRIELLRIIGDIV